MSKYFGRIFVPQEYGLEYCKSPQAVAFDTFVRIYFSYCVPDGEKLISKVAFAEYDKSFSEVKRVKTDVMSGGKLGAFDEHGIFPFSPFFDGGVLKAITTGWSRRQSVSTETALGLAVSNDNGETFSRVGDGPALAPSLNEPYLVADGFVYKRNEHEYMMYYIFGTEWENYQESHEPERTYKIALATSKNLLDWKRTGEPIIPDRIDREAQALPSLVEWNGKYHMVFCYRDSVGFRQDYSRSYRLGYAVSDDLYHWTRDDAALSFVTKEEWAAEMQCYPNFFTMDGRLYLLYNGNHFGKNGFGLVECGDEL